MTTATTATTNTQTDTNGSTNGSTGSKAIRPPTAVEAITKVSKILDQLSDVDRKRVMAFLNASNE